MFTNEGYALLIGVNDYGVFDASRSQAAGTSDLRGSVNDVRTFWRLCRMIGMKPANMRVLTSPPIDFHELEGATAENVAPATEAEILAKVGWLAEKLAQPSRPSGLLTYSGHGSFCERQGFVLCPSDVVYQSRPEGEIDRDHAVSFRTLNAIFDRHGAADNLTVVLDTCHAGGAGEAAHGRAASLTSLSLGGAPLPEGAASAELTELRGRVLAAASRGELAYQSMFDGHFRGVFSWAVSATVEQWKARQVADGVVQLDLSYGDLIETSRRVIDALWFKQTPELHAPNGTSALAVFHKGPHARAGETSPKPNGSFLTAQLDGGTRPWRQYTLTFPDGTQLATVQVFNQTVGTFVTTYEYWYANKDSFSQIGVNDLTIAHVDKDATTLPTDPGYTNEQKFTVVKNASWGTGWTTDPLDVTNCGPLYSGSGAIYLRVKVASGVVSRVSWEQVLTSGSPANMTPNGTFRYTTGTVSVPSGSTGYDITQKPGAWP